MSSPKTYYVRLKPYNKRRGYLCRNFMIGGVRFTSRWKEVSAAKARELEAITQPHDKDREISLFDIKTREEAEKIEEKEREDGVKAARVKDAERVPDSSFRDDRPKMNEETGELISTVEPAEVVTDPKPIAPSVVDDETMPADATPAPSLRDSTGRANVRTE